MKELLLKAPLLDEDNNPVPNQTLAGVLAKALVYSNTGDAVKYLDWALDLKTSGRIIVDNSDFNTLKEFVQSTPTLTNLAKGRLQKAFLGEIPKAVDKPAPAPAAVPPEAPPANPA